MGNQVDSKIKVIVTGATGMVGEGVLHECLLSNKVEQVLVINRKPCGVTHPKLREIIHSDFFHLSPIQHQLSNYDACLFCLGVSSVGMKEHDYYRLTYTLTMQVAETLSAVNADLTFCYISGTGTDSTEQGRMMWARIKGKTENDLAKLFKKEYNFRPGILTPTKGLKNTLNLYKYLGWLLPLIKIIYPRMICSLKELGAAMINASVYGYEKQNLEVRDIIALSKKHLD